MYFYFYLFIQSNLFCIQETHVISSSQLPLVVEPMTLLSELRNVCLITKSDGSFKSVDTMPIDFIVSENQNAHQIVHVSSLFC